MYIKKIAAVSVGLAASVAALAGCGSSSSVTDINLDDYVAVEFGGHDGYGTASKSFDYEAFAEDYDDVLTEHLEGLDVSGLTDAQKEVV